MRRFGVSTYLYHHLRLRRDHLLEIAAQGFESVELCAERAHFDYHNPAAIADLQQWLAEGGLELGSVHAPVGNNGHGTTAGSPFTLASVDEDRRLMAMTEAERALQIARRIPFRQLVTHLGIPRFHPAAASDNSRDAARRSIEALERLAEPLGVTIAVEVMPNELSRPGSLVHFVETVLQASSVGICLDFGHAHLDGDLVDAIET